MWQRSGFKAQAIALVLCSIASLATTAWGQTASQAAARRLLLDQATQASNAGNHAQALDLAQRAGALQMSSSVRYFIANEEHQLGRLAAAFGDADLCVREASREARSPNRDSVTAACRSMVDSLRNRVGQVTVTVPTPPPDGLRVMVAGEVLDPSLYGVGTVVTPGSVLIEATAPNRESFRREVTIAAGGAMMVVAVEMAVTNSPAPTTQETNSSSSPATTDSSQAPVTHQPTTTPTQSTGLGPVRAMGLAAGLVGVVSVIGGVIGWVLVDQVYQNCTRQPCQRMDEPRTEDSAAVGLMIGGAAVTVIGAALFLFGPSSHQESHSHVTGFWIDPHGGAGLTGRF